MNKVILTADSTCDIGPLLQEQYGIAFAPYHITVGKRTGYDNVDIFADEIYQAWWNDKILPKTGAVNMIDYIELFKKYVDEGYDVVHICLGSGLSSSYQNCCLAAQELGHVYPVDSANLSTGSGLLVLEAADRIAAGMDAATIQREITDLREKVCASFIVDSTEFLRAGGRCSSLASFGANLLNIKPEIVVRFALCGGMTMGKKYHGKLEKALAKYASDVLQTPDIDNRRVFITHSGISQERIDIVRDVIEETHPFDNVYITRASCTISSHCGPNTLGVLFLTK